MLRALRNQTNSIFFKCFLVLLICGFALWGVGDLTGGVGEKKVLIVDREYVTVENVINELNRIRYSLPERITLQEAIKKGMHINVLQKFEREILLNTEAKSLHLSVPIAVQTRAIIQENSFKDALGKFSQSKFLQSLKNAGLSEAKYLDIINSEANRKQISMPYSFNENYNEKIIKKLMNWQNETRDINYEIFEIINKEEIPMPSDNILKTFYKSFKENYKIPSTRNVRYLEINPSIFEDQVVINQKQIDEKYEIEKSNYFIEEKREILQITTQDKVKANEFINSIGKGNNFSEIAKKYFDLSESDTNIGFLKKSDLPSDSADKIFKAELNQVLGPINTKFGFSVYKIINIAPKRNVNYDDAIKDVKEKLLKELSVEILFEKLEEIEDLIAEGYNLDEISKSKLLNNKIFIKEINMISRNGSIYSYSSEKRPLNKNKIFLNNIWGTEVNELSQIFNSVGDIYNLIEVVGENLEELPPFEKIKNNVYKNWLSEEVILKSKDRAKKEVFKMNNNLSLKSNVERSSKSIDKINDIFLINKIFDIENKDINYLRSQNYIFAVKVLNIKTKKYILNKERYNNLNTTMSRSFFNDFSSFYLQNLAIKHNLKRNYSEINNFINKQDLIN